MVHVYVCLVLFDSFSPMYCVPPGSFVNGIDPIKNPGRNINNLRYTDDTTHKEELKSLLMKVKEESEKLA